MKLPFPLQSLKRKVNKKYMKKYSETIISGVNPKFIREYFDKVSDTYGNNNVYFGENWKVEIIYNEDRRLHNISIPQTKVTFESDKFTLDKIVNDFRMKFLSAGG